MCEGKERNKEKGRKRKKKEERKKEKDKERKKQTNKQRKKKKNNNNNKIENFTFDILDREKDQWNSGCIFSIRITKCFHLSLG